jgi:hypothetical protein
LFPVSSSHPYMRASFSSRRVSLSSTGTPKCGDFRAFDSVAPLPGRPLPRTKNPSRPNKSLVSAPPLNASLGSAWPVASLHASEMTSFGGYERPPWRTSKVRPSRPGGTPSRSIRAMAARTCSRVTPAGITNWSALSSSTVKRPASVACAWPTDAARDSLEARTVSSTWGRLAV